MGPVIRKISGLLLDMPLRHLHDIDKRGVIGGSSADRLSHGAKCTICATTNYDDYYRGALLMDEEERF